jgi:hypothetical protein
MEMNMKFSEATLAMLKNFATINAGVVLNPGHVQRTWSIDMSILVEVELEENMPTQFGIYDLNQFLGNITTLSDPELDFTSERVVMKDSSMNILYRSCDANLIKSPPNKSLSIDNPDITFDLSQATLTKMLRLASMNNLSTISVIGTDGRMKMQAHDKSNDKSNEVFSDLCEWTGEDFSCMFKVDNLKIIPDDYVVEIKKNAFSKFASKNRKLKYFITLQTK